MTNIYIEEEYINKNDKDIIIYSYVYLLFDDSSKTSFFKFFKYKSKINKHFYFKTIAIIKIKVRKSTNISDYWF